MAPALDLALKSVTIVLLVSSILEQGVKPDLKQLKAAETLYRGLIILLLRYSPENWSAFLLSSVWLVLFAFSPERIDPTPAELQYGSSPSSKPAQLGAISDEATCALSVVVPAYNEKLRMETMLRETVGVLNDPKKEWKSERDGKDADWEVLIVDDGSTDGTKDEALRLAGLLDSKGRIKVVRLDRNRGKGGAVRHGVSHASGSRIIFADADGASSFACISLLQAALDKLPVPSGKAAEQGLVVGSRAHLVNTEAVVKRSWMRNFLMRGFHTYLWIMGVRGVADTQCGFKLCTRATAKHVYPPLHSPSWIFDTELILLCVASQIPVLEVGITWREIEGSKLDVIKDSIKMAIDLLVIRGNYLLGRWQLPGRVDTEPLAAPGVAKAS